MRESQIIDENFGNVGTRMDIINDKEFVYGHYQIGDSPKMWCKTLGKGFATVGGLRVGNKFYYAVALCSPNDNFSKKFGRYLVQNHMVDEDDSHKRGVVELTPELTDEQPAVVLKYALEQYLRKAKRLPPWTRQPVLFRGQRLVINRNDPVILKRRQAALKAWDTRRSRA